jgi:hypothetical protein
MQSLIKPRSPTAIAIAHPMPGTKYGKTIIAMPAMIGAARCWLLPQVKTA